ncbi:hypothetical protein [Scytonema hofmannii]|nr:hypothetical protein [Scytonema hofmannii]
MRCKRVQILPSRERQVRLLIKLEPNEHRSAWQMTVEEAGKKSRLVRKK